MSYASLRRRAAAPVLVAMLTVVPLGVTATVATAAPAGAPTAVSAPATKSVAATKTVAPVKKKPLTKKQKRALAKKKHKLALKKAAAKKNAKPKAIAHALVERKYKWSHRQWTCLKKLWTRESGWRVKADNPTSSAYGIPQALPGHKMGKGWRHSARTQIKWGLRYIDGRYNTPCAADRHQRNHNWY